MLRELPQLPQPLVQKWQGSSTLLKELYTEAIAFAKCFVALRDAVNLFTFASLASHFTVIVLLAALDCAALSWDSWELRWGRKGMFWCVGASGYHQDREKQHKSFHNLLHNILVRAHPKTTVFGWAPSVSSLQLNIHKSNKLSWMLTAEHWQLQPEIFSFRMDTS